MKLLVLSALFATVLGQDTQKQSKVNVLVPDVNLHDEDKLEAQSQEIEIKFKNQGFNPVVDPVFQNGQPLLGREQFHPDKALQRHQHERQGPMPGQQQFNPSRFVPNQPMIGRQQFNPTIPNQPMLGQQQFNPTRLTPPHHPRPGQEEFNPFQFVPDHPMVGQEQFNKPYEHKKKKNLKSHSRSQDGTNDQFWQEGVPHMKNQKKIWKKIALVAAIFTLLGVCVGKCCRKCKKNKKKRIQQMMRRTRTALQVGQQIKQQEKKLAELKSELEIKKAEEIRRQQQAQFRSQQHEMRNINQVHYYPQQPQQFYYPRPHIAVGRPINENTNYQFMNEYPQL